MHVHVQDAEHFESRQSKRGYKPPGARRNGGEAEAGGRGGARAANGSAREPGSGLGANGAAKGAMELDAADAFEADAVLAGLGVRASEELPRLPLVPKTLSWTQCQAPCVASA